MNGLEKIQFAKIGNDKPGLSCDRRCDIFFKAINN